MSNPILRKAATGAFEEAIEVLPEGFPTQRTGGRRNFSRHFEELETLKAQAEEIGRLTGFGQGYVLGVETGREDGLKRIRTEMEEAHAALTAETQQELKELNERIAAGLEAWYQATAEAVADLSVVIAEKVLSDTLATDPGKIVKMTMECLAEVTHAHTARVMVDATALPALKKAYDDLLAVSPSLRSLELVADPSIGQGVVIDTDGGRIDGRVSTQIRAIWEAMHHD